MSNNDSNNISTGATTAGFGQTWTLPRKSSACPYCTPRCPHGYPADEPWLVPFVQPAPPWPYGGIIYTQWPASSGTSITFTANQAGDKP